MILPLLAALSVLPTAFPLPAQEAGGGARLEGRVVAAGSQAPLSGTVVGVVGADLRTTANERGAFTLRGVPAGAVTLTFSRLGYAPLTRELEVATGERTVLTVSLSPLPVGVDPIVVLSHRTRMVGDPLNLAAIPGSAHFLSRQDLEARRLAFDDIHEILRRVPGVNVQDEDGFGLRPNIGLRGTGVSRSSKVTLMEDGVLIAPAPYAAPAAYYFPVAGRMEAVEVRKGSSQVRYGPRTVGGAINLVSASIPEEPAWELDTQGGDHRTWRVRARAGDAGRHFGWIAETYQIGTDGFKEFQAGGTTGFRVEDYVAKLRFNTDRDGPRYQELEVKLGYHDEVSDETYLGLTHADFQATPLLRYPASRPDRMDAGHRQIQLRHFVQPSSAVDITTTVYHNDFARNWYKLASVRGRGLSGVLADPGAFAEELAILRGADSEDHALVFRANNREYYSHGVQSVLGARADGERFDHAFELGVRFHRDQEDRFQWDDGYRMSGGAPVRTSEGRPGTQANRVGDAQASAVYLQDEIRSGRWTLVPGVRYERIELTRTDYPTDDPRRDTPLQVRKTMVSAFVPGIGASFAVDSRLHLFGGVHRGFGPPGPGAAEGTQPEESVNYEIGTRLRRAGVALQVAGFFSDYRNILGQATLASGESGAGELYNGGAARTGGVETSFDYDLGWSLDLPVQIPVSLSYTFTHATFRTAFESDFDAWGSVEPGDHLPYLPQHQFSGSVGIEEGAWEVTLTATGVSPARTRAGQGPATTTESTDGYLVFNLQGAYELSDKGGARLFAGVQNLTDEHYIVARRPAGARPGLPRTAFVGMRLSR